MEIMLPELLEVENDMDDSKVNEVSPADINCCGACG